MAIISAEDLGSLNGDNQGWQQNERPRWFGMSMRLSEVNPTQDWVEFHGTAIGGTPGLCVDGEKVVLRVSEKAVKTYIAVPNGPMRYFLDDASRNPKMYDGSVMLFSNVYRHPADGALRASKSWLVNQIENGRERGKQKDILCGVMGPVRLTMTAPAASGVAPGKAETLQVIIHPVRPSEEGARFLVGYRSPEGGAMTKNLMSASALVEAISNMTKGIDPKSGDLQRVKLTATIAFPDKAVPASKECLDRDGLFVASDGSTLRRSVRFDKPEAAEAAEKFIEEKTAVFIPEVTCKVSPVNALKCAMGLAEYAGSLADKKEVEWGSERVLRQFTGMIFDSEHTYPPGETHYHRVVAAVDPWKDAEGRNGYNLSVVVPASSDPASARLHLVDFLPDELRAHLQIGEANVSAPQVVLAEKAVQEPENARAPEDVRERLLVLLMHLADAVEAINRGDLRATDVSMAFGKLTDDAGAIVSGALKTEADIQGRLKQLVDIINELRDAGVRPGEDMVNTMRDWVRSTRVMEVAGETRQMDKAKMGKSRQVASEMAMAA